MSEEKAEQLPGIGKIHAALVAVMGEVGGVGKTRKNESQHYSYRGIADITLACQPLMAKHGIHVVPHVVLKDDIQEFQTAKGATMFRVRQTIQFRFYHSDGSYVPCETTGEGMDSGDKATNKAMSSALKYCLVQTFCIPEADPADTEKDSPEVTGRAAQTRQAAPKHVPAPTGEPLAEDQRAQLLEAASRHGITKGGLLALCSKTLSRPITGSQDIKATEFQKVLEAVMDLPVPADVA